MTQLVPDEYVISRGISNEIEMRHFHGYFKPLGFPEVPSLYDYGDLIQLYVKDKAGNEVLPKVFDGMYMGKDNIPAKSYYLNLISEIIVALAHDVIKAH